MTWCYGLIKDKDNFFRLTEIFSDNCHTTEPIEISGDSKEEIINQLETILADLKSNLEIITED